MALDQLTQALDQLEPHGYPQAAQLAVQRLTDDQLLEHRLWCSDVEPKRREAEKAKAEAQAEVIQQIWETNPDLKPDFAENADRRDQVPAWVQPTGAHNAYPPHAVVQHGGQVWQNIAGKLNAWEPGNDGPVPTWVRIETEQTETHPEPTQADGTREHPISWKAGLTLKRGQYTTYEGKVYQLAQDHVSQDHWRPGPGLESIYTPVS